MKLFFCLVSLLGATLFTQTLKAASSLNVQTSCGARGNGSTDDTNAIQSCINQAYSGQTVYFPNGRYNLSKSLYLKGGVSYTGQSVSAVLHMNYMGQPIFWFPWSGANNITISSLTFDQGGIDTNGNGETPKNVRITNCVFQNMTQVNGNWTQRNFIFADNGLSNSQIDHNSFSMLLANGLSVLNGNADYDGDIPRSAIFAYGLDNTSIDHNTFDHVYQGIKVCQVLPYETQNAYIGWNTMTHIHRMGMEIQDASGCGRPKPPGVYYNSKNFVIENNSLLGWDNYYWGSFGISFANIWSDTTIVRNNTIKAPAYFSTFRGMGIEVGGRPAQVYGNTLSGPWGASIAVFSGSVGSDVHDNYACSVQSSSTPTISDEMNPSPTDTYYHANTTTIGSCR
jgi:hypothetical protein